MNTISNVCIYCASSSKINESYFRAAEAVGTLLAHKGVGVITGAGSIGLMNAVENAVLSNGGKAIGVIPQFMVDAGWCHQGLSELIVTGTMHERKRKMAEMSQGAIALPGGCGTLEEVLEVITWKQLGLYLHPIVLLNLNGYYNGLLEQLQHGIDEHFMGQRHACLWQVATTPEEAVGLLFTTPLWDPTLGKQAAL